MSKDRIWIDQTIIKDNKQLGKFPFRSGLAQEIFSFEQRFNKKAVGIIFNRKENGNPNFTVDLLTEPEGDASMKINLTDTHDEIPSHAPTS